MVCSASVDILHMGVPKMRVIDHKGPLSAGKVGAISCKAPKPASAVSSRAPPVLSGVFLSLSLSVF